MIDLKKNVCFLITILIISSIPGIYAQQILLGQPAEQTVEIKINHLGQVHVIHKIQKSINMQQVNVIEGSVSNLIVHDSKGDDVQHAIVGGETMGISILDTNVEAFVEYDLDDVLFSNEGVWKWEYLYPATSVFIFPENLDLIFVNEVPVYLKDIRGITCHGCSANLEYILNEPINFEQVKWDNQNFEVGIRTVTEITSFTFDQPTKSINFFVNEPNQFVTLIIPLELLWNPYETYLDEQKIFKQEFFQNETHAWLNIRPETSGQIQIIGSTVIPEFPPFLPLIFGISSVLILKIGNRLIPH